DLGPRVGVVELDVLDVAAGHDIGAAPTALLPALENLVLDLHVPGVVELAGLQHGARGGGRIAAALHLDLIEEGPIGHVVGGIELAANDVAGLEVDKPVGSGPDGLQVGRRLARLVTLEDLEEMLGDDHAGRPTEGGRPEGSRRFECELYGVAVELVDPGDIAVLADSDRGRTAVPYLLPVQ